MSRSESLAYKEKSLRLMRGIFNQAFLLLGVTWGLCCVQWAEIR